MTAPTSREQMVEALREFHTAVMRANARDLRKSNAVGAAFQHALDLASRLPSPPAAAESREPMPPDYLEPGETRIGNENWWVCKIGPAHNADVPPGGDLPMRQGLKEVFRRVIGDEPAHVFSGWGHGLTEPQRAVVEDRLPRRQPVRDCRVAHEATEEMLLAAVKSWHEQPVQLLDDTMRDVYAAMERARVARVAVAAGGVVVVPQPLPDQVEYIKWLQQQRSEPAAPEPAAGEGVGRERLMDALYAIDRFTDDPVWVAGDLAMVLLARGLSLDEVVKVATGGGE